MEERTRYDFWVPPALVLHQNKILGYSARNRKSKRLKQHFQPSATRYAPKQDTKSAVALALHGGARRGSYPVCRFLARWKHSELDRKTKCPRQTKGGRRASIGFVVGTF